MRADAPILLFDSGVGGLSVLARVRRVLPAAPVVYVADNGFYPYGTRSEAEIAARVPALLGRLVERYRPRLVAIPCNTASTIALPVIRAALDVPVVGTVPAIKPAAARSRSRAIGVLGTHATVRQPYVDRLVGEFAADCLVLRHGSAALVDAAEAKLRGAPTDAALVARELAGLLEQPGGERVDTVVLACTHFPLLAEELRAAAPHIAFVDSGDGIARRVAHLLQGQAFAPGPADRAVFTAAVDIAPPFRAALAGYGLGEVGTF
ncbi:MAG TPA: glutamate racemase [Sphingomonadaceae bacterium]|nr:glutamate racemase [Sphingomonadaceae bacterium]